MTSPTTTTRVTGPCCLDVDSVRKSYPAPHGGSSLVLDVPELRVEEAAQLAIEGESGSGKTTLLHIVAGLVTPDSGRVVVTGLDLTALDEAARDRARAENIGVIFQSFNLLQPYTVLENVMLPMSFAGRADVDRAAALLERVGLSDRLDYRPAQLSPGQQQRVAIARALANQPKLVLADEPTGSLDARRAEASLALIREVCEEAGAALLLVSHNPSVLERFTDRACFADLNRARPRREEP